jgi:hypothetical protein
LLGPRAGLPGYVAVPGVTRPGPPPTNLFVGGWLGQRYAPFATGGTPAEPDFTVSLGRQDGPPSPNLEDEARPGGIALADGLDPPRLARRARLRETLDHALRAAESHGDALGSQFGDAFHLLSSPEIRRAFDIGLETEATRAAYGRTKIGGRCLLARRLVEAGARFVMVDYGYDPDYGNLWDNHRVPTQRQPHICEIVKQPYHLAGTDRACAGLIADLAARGLLESTLVVFLTEFGRTPRINKDGGRDHWGSAGSLFFAGGGAASGRVIGATDRIGGHPTGRAYSPSDVAATIYHALGIDRGAMLDDPLGRPHAVLAEGEPVPIFG